MSRDDYGLADECPKCGALSYKGGHCFGCGTYRPAKRTDTHDLEDLDAVDYMERSYGTRVEGLPISEEKVDERQSEGRMRRKHAPKKQQHWKPVIITDGNLAEAALLVQALVQPYESTPDGELVRAVEFPWRAIVQRLKNDWSRASEISPRAWEEMIAAAFDQEGFDEVILTPRSADYGRDVIAVRRGFGCIRIIGSVKAYKPGHLVKQDDVRALAGVLLGDPQASKGILTTTSDFAPGIAKDPFLAPLMPYRLELMNGTQLQHWLTRLAK